jgi:hypothetical protein
MSVSTRSELSDAGKLDGPKAEHTLLGHIELRLRMPLFRPTKVEADVKVLDFNYRTSVRR